MNLNLLTLFAPPGRSRSAPGATNATPSGAPSGANFGDIAFGQLLQAQIRNLKRSAPLANVSANVAQTRQLGAALKATITQLLQNGATLEHVVDQIAQTLGTKFLSQLQTQLGAAPGSDVQTMLNHMLAQALGPPANGPPATAAQTAAALVGRLMHVADALAGASGNAAGQQLERLGTVLDANAKDNPAPTGTTLLQAALSALEPLLTALVPSPNANASPSSSTSSGSANVAATPGGIPQQAPPVPGPAPWVPTTSSSSAHPQGSASSASAPAVPAVAQIAMQTSDGPTVALNPVLTLVGTGGDSVIGRILARAANVAATQTPPQQQAAQNAPDSTATLQPQLAVSATAAAASGNGEAILASVLRSLQTTLASLPAPKNDSAPADADSAPVAPTQSSSSVFASLGIGPMVNTTADPPAANAAAMPTQSQAPAAYADPNAIVDQVLRGISMRSLPDGTQSIRMRLVPESLGDVAVTLQVQNGAVNAAIVAQNADVRDTLLANQQMLMRSLQDAGLKLASFTVNLSNNGAQYQQQQSAYQSSFGTTRRYAGISSGSDAPVAAIPTYGPPQTQLAALQWLNALA